MQLTLRALADPIRRGILELLKSGRLSAGEVAYHFPVTSAAISRYLSVSKRPAWSYGSVCFAEFFLVCHIICTFSMFYDPKRGNIGGKLISILLWVLPITSVITSMCILYAYALNLKVNIAVICI